MTIQNSVRLQKNQNKLVSFGYTEKFCLFVYIESALLRLSSNLLIFFKYHD